MIPWRFLIACAANPGGATRNHEDLLQSPNCRCTHQLDGKTASRNSSRRRFPTFVSMTHTAHVAVALDGAVYDHQGRCCNPHTVEPITLEQLHALGSEWNSDIEADTVWPREIVALAEDFGICPRANALAPIIDLERLENQSKIRMTRCSWSR